MIMVVIKYSRPGINKTRLGSWLRVDNCSVGIRFGVLSKQLIMCGLKAVQVIWRSLRTAIIFVGL